MTPLARTSVRLLAVLLSTALVAGCDELPFATDDDRTDQIVHVSTANSHACALTRDGRVFCWGDNAEGRLGTGNSDAIVEPVRVALPAPATWLSTADRGGCVVADENLYCWGSVLLREDGELDRVQLGQGRQWAFIAAEAYVWDPYVCAVTTGGHGFCWRAENPLSEPEPLAPELRWRSIDIGVNHSCGVTTDARGYCWGRNGGGALGIGVVDSVAEAAARTTPHEVTGDHRWRDIQVHSNGACGVTLEGPVYCWGSEWYGFPLPPDLPSTTPRHTPFPMGISGVELAVGVDHVCVVDRIGGVACWGGNERGQLGRGDFAAPLSPALVRTDLDFLDADAATGYTCGITHAREVACWGSNGRLQLGDGSAVDRPAPVLVQLR